MVILRYILDVLFIITLILLAFIPKKGKLWRLWVIFFILNLGIRGYLIYRGHIKDKKISELEHKIGEVGEVATRDIYRPLTQGLKEDIVLGLEKIRNKYRQLDVNISITHEKGNRAGDKVANELSRLLVESGFNAKTKGPVITNLNGEVHIKLNPNDNEFANELHKVIRRFINTRFNGLEDAKLAKGTIEIHIIAEPLFSTDGIITFR